MKQIEVRICVINFVFFIISLSKLENVLILGLVMFFKGLSSLDLGQCIIL